MAETTSGETAPSSAMKRYVFIGVPIVLIVVIGLVAFWPRIELSFKINGLNSDNPDTRRTLRTQLVEAPREDWIDEAIVSAVADSSRTFAVRHTLVDILIERERLPMVEKAYLAGSLDTRTVILAALQGRPYFTDTYVADPRYDVEGTVRAWVKRDGDFTRSHAIQIAMQLDLSDTMADIRPLFAEATSDTPVAGTKRRDLVVAALGAAQKFGDCESIPAMLDLAETANTGLVRWRAAQGVDRLVTGDEPACAGAVTEERMTELLVKLLGDEDPTPRIGALTNLEMHPERARGAADAIVAILDQEGYDDGPERRHALHALMAIGDPAFLDRLPVYFFDPNTNVRSSLAQKAIAIEIPRLDSCLIGLVDREMEAEIVFRSAAESLRRRSGAYHGLPEILQARARNDRNKFWTGLAAIMGGATVDGATREDMVKGWFLWLANDLKLDSVEQTRAWETRLAFWDAADADDVDGARKALDDFGTRVPGLFTYEEAWLERNA